MSNLKIYALFLASLFIAFDLEAQFESIFGESTTAWSNSALICDAVFTDRYFHDRDTLVSNFQYRIINEFGLIRESSEKDKLWYRGFFNDDEILLMDLNLSSGDVFEIGSNSFSVDSVFMEDGLKVIQFDYIPPNCGFEQPMRFREGNGPTLGFQFMISGNKDDAKHSRCYTRDDVTVNYLSMYLGDECYNDIVNTSEIVNTEISISPNPFNSVIKLEFTTSENRRIILQDINGKKIEEFICNQKLFEINGNGLNSGIYILTILKGQEMFTKKVVKKIKMITLDKMEELLRHSSSYHYTLSLITKTRMILLFKSYYVFWNSLSFGMKGMQYRAIGCSVALLLGIVNFINSTFELVELPFQPNIYIYYFS